MRPFERFARQPGSQIVSLAHHYVDITSWAQGRMILDNEKVHDVMPDEISDPDSTTIAEPVQEQS